MDNKNANIGLIPDALFAKVCEDIQRKVPHSNLLLSDENIQRTRAYFSNKLRYGTMADVNFSLGRLGGIGGSDCAIPMYKMFRGKGRDDFGRTMHDLCSEKQCASYLSAPAYYLERGNDIEPHSNKELLEKLVRDVGQSSVKILHCGMSEDHNDSLALIDPSLRVAFNKEIDRHNDSFKNRDERFQWMIGNPDLVLEIAGDVYIVDGKNNSSAGSSAVTLTYSDQLHYYAMLWEAVTKIQVKGLFINWSSPDERSAIRVDPHFISLDRGRYAQLEKACSATWDLVQRGVVPEKDRTHNSTETIQDEEFQSQVKECAARIVFGKQLEDAGKAIVTDNKNKLQDLISNNANLSSEGSVEVPGLVTATTTPNYLGASTRENLTNFFIQQNYIADASEMEKVVEDIDPQLAVDALKAQAQKRSIAAKEQGKDISPSDLLARYRKTTFDSEKANEFIARAVAEGTPLDAIPGYKESTAVRIKTGAGKPIQEALKSAFENNALGGSVISVLTSKSSINVKAPLLFEESYKAIAASDEDLAKNLSNLSMEKDPPKKTRGKTKSAVENT